MMADLVDAMQESHHTFDYPESTALVRHKASVEGSRAAARVRATGTWEPIRRDRGRPVMIRDSDRTGGLALFYLATTREPEMPFPSTERLGATAGPRDYSGPY